MTCNVSEYRLGNLSCSVFLIEQEKLQTLCIFDISIIIIPVNHLALFQALLLIPKKVDVSLTGKWCDRVWFVYIWRVDSFCAYKVQVGCITFIYLINLSAREREREKETAKIKYGLFFTKGFSRDNIILFKILKWFYLYFSDHRLEMNTNNSQIYNV